LRYQSPWRTREILSPAEGWHKSRAPKEATCAMSPLQQGLWHVVDEDPAESRIQEVNPMQLAPFPLQQIHPRKLSWLGWCSARRWRRFRGHLSEAERAIGFEWGPSADFPFGIERVQVGPEARALVSVRAGSARRHVFDWMGVRRFSDAEQFWSGVPKLRQERIFPKSSQNLNSVWLRFKSLD